jgi:hypothetical protein
MNFLSQTNAAPSGQVEQEPEVEFAKLPRKPVISLGSEALAYSLDKETPPKSARTDCGHADRIDDDAKLASNNLDTLMPDVANINSRN